MKEKTNEALSLQVNGGNAVQFNKNNNGCDTFTLSVIGDKDDYIETMKSILHYLGSIGDDYCNREYRYLMCNLLESMLPDHTQIISPADAILLQQLKETKGGVL